MILNIIKVSGTNSNSFSTSYIEKPELTIPPKTLINISEFNITNSRYINCDLNKYPSRDDIKTLKFEKNNSPFVFYNLITYSIKGDTIRVENKFYISEITNYIEKEMFTEIDTSICGRHLEFTEEVFKNATPDKFYIKYIRER